MTEEESGTAELAEFGRRLAVETDPIIIGQLEDEAEDIAEALGVEFVYTRYDGRERTYYPAANWEASSGCEWEESAEYGVHYGWNVY